MTSITKFEDLIAWQEARTLVKMIYGLTADGTFSKDFGMRDQIQRAAVSVMTNIAEGFDCESTAEFARFLGIARRSAVEVQSLLYAALDVGHIKQDVFKFHYEHAKKVQSVNWRFEARYPQKSPPCKFNEPCLNVELDTWNLEL